MRALSLSFLRITEKASRRDNTCAGWVEGVFWVQSDFDRLYRALGVGPACEVAAFQQAYRRRISILHPDKARGRVEHERESLLLHEFQSLYKQAMVFHAAHGRLPGAVPSARRVEFGEIPRQAPFRDTRPDQDMRVSGWPTAMWIVVAASVLGLLWFGATGGGPQVPSPMAATGMASEPAIRPIAPAPFAATPEATTETAQGAGLRKGMTARDVERDFGAPVIVDGSDWWYGASWIRFERGRVSAWYSSPLRPLRIAPVSSADDAILGDASGQLPVNEYPPGH